MLCREPAHRPKYCTVLRNRSGVEEVRWSGSRDDSRSRGRSTIDGRRFDLLPGISRSSQGNG